MHVWHLLMDQWVCFGDREPPGRAHFFTFVLTEMEFLSMGGIILR